MNPPGVLVRALHVKPESLPLDHLRDVPVKQLRNLGRSYIGLAQHWCDRRDGCDALGQCSGQSIFVEVLGIIGGSGRFARHVLHSVTPRKLQMMQTKVPQSAHGYPSDARSSFPQERHIITSFSRRFFAMYVWEPERNLTT
jgi:hypothetical protein